MSLNPKPDRKRVRPLKKATLPPRPAVEADFARELFADLRGFWVSAALYAAARLEIADRLATGPKTVNELAESLGARPARLYRLLRALSSIGVFKEGTERRFELTPKGELLSKDHPHSVSGVALLYGDKFYRAWGDLLSSITSGKSAYELVFDKPLFDSLRTDDALLQTFNRAMTSISVEHALGVLASYDFSHCRKIVDIGGGYGFLLTEILKKYPLAHGVVLDMPEVVARAGVVPLSSDVVGRLTYASGDFFHSVPPGADTYVMKYIIHDWDDNSAGQILRNTRAQMVAGSRLLVVDMILPDDNTPHFGKFVDLNMMVVLDGKERTRQEFESLLGEAGLQIDRVIPTPSHVSIIECTLNSTHNAP